MALQIVSFKESTKTDYLYDEEIFNSNAIWRKIENQFNKNICQNRSDRIRIPKIIHQIWLGSGFPREYLSWQKSWKKHNPNWEYRLWTDKEADEFHFENKEIFYQTSNLGAKSDILRYFILRELGGVYVDTDFECLDNFDDLHAKFDFYTGLIYSGKPYLGNGIIGCIPNHPIILKLCKSITSPHLEQSSGILDFSGPGLFTACVFDQAFDNSYINIIFPVTYFYSFPNNKLHIKNPRKKGKYYKIESIAVHHWEVSWTRTTVIKKLLYRALKYIPVEIKNKVKIILKIKQKF
jgi:inositol phosphorylceramide mannosyltransferase catalytic subunit